VNLGTSQTSAVVVGGTTAATLGFFGVEGALKITISGARDNPEGALANLLSALAGYILIVDNTTAS
jgi:hypothetical protein